MTTQISKSEMEKLAKSSDGVQDDFKAAAKTIGGLGTTQLNGFQTQQAIQALNKRWAEKANWGAGRWQYFAGAIRETSKDISGTDEKTAFSLPKGIPGVAN